MCETLPRSHCLRCIEVLLSDPLAQQAPVGGKDFISITRSIPSSDSKLSKYLDPNNKKRLIIEDDWKFVLTAYPVTPGDPAPPYPGGPGSPLVPLQPSSPGGPLPPSRPG